MIMGKNKNKFEIKSDDKYKSYENEYIIECINLNLWYEKIQALKDINIKFKKNKVTAIIGPSGCGKSTLLRCLNRMNDVIEGCNIKGVVLFNEKNIYENKVDVRLIRKKIGMIFQKPNPFPMSIYDNIVYGPRIHKIENDEILGKITEKCLKRAALWDEVKDRLKDPAMGLSLGQQQRLCIARALAVEPDVLLMDEPTSSLDPIATQKIENLILDLKKHCTIIIVTHNMQQAVRISDYTGFMYLGEMIEFGETNQIFEKPNEKLTKNYIRGLFG